MVLSGTVNKRLVRMLLDAGVAAVGLSGEDGDLLRCAPFGDGALGRVGVPEVVNPAVLGALFAAGFVPVVSPLGLAGDGFGCNVNGDDAAAAIAAALGADELLLVVDVPGVLDAEGGIIPSLDLDALDAILGNGTAHGGMIAKLQAARRALLGGVARVRIGDFAAIPDASVGTRLSSTSTLAV
jgi:acetylglutamate kinase